MVGIFSCRWITEKLISLWTYQKLDVILNCLPSSLAGICRKRDNEGQSRHTQFIMISIWLDSGCFSFWISKPSNQKPTENEFWDSQILISFLLFFTLLPRVELIVSSWSKDDTYNHFWENEVEKKEEKHTKY